MFFRLAVIPGMIWLLLPPVCICHLPEQLLGLPYYEDPWLPDSLPGEEDHAPGCPAARKFTPYPTEVVPIDVVPQYLIEWAPVPVAVCLVGELTVAPCGCDWIAQPATFHPHGNRLYLSVRALLC